MSEPEYKVPGRLWRALARLWLVPRANAVVEDAHDAGYVDWESATASGVWEYYSRFLPQDHKALTILDVACGPAGRTRVHASKTEARFIAVDRDAALQHSNREETSRENLRLVSGDAYRLPLRDGAADVVLCENAMEHFTDPARAVAEMARVLKPDGLLFLVFPPWRSPYASHLWSITLFPWLQLWPDRLLRRFLEALHVERRDPGDSRAAAAGCLANMKATLNARSLADQLESMSRPDLVYVSGYVVPEWRWATALRFLPILGEFFSSAVYIVFRRGRASTPAGRLSFATLQWSTIEWFLRNRR